MGMGEIAALRNRPSPQILPSPVQHRAGSVALTAESPQAYHQEVDRRAALATEEEDCPLRGSEIQANRGRTGVWWQGSDLN